MKNNSDMKLITSGTIMLLCLVGVFCNVLVLRNYDISSRKQEYAMLYTMGISKKIIKKLVTTENHLLFIISGSIYMSFVIIYTLIANSSSMLLPESAISSEFYTCFGILVVIDIVSTLLIKGKINKIKIPRDLA